MQAQPDTAPTDAPQPTALAQTAPDWESGPWVVNGVALGENERVVGAAGDPVYYPPDVLEAAAEALVGRSIVDDRDHDEDSFGRMQPAVENIIGEVTATSYKPGVGILFEGEIDDPETAKQVERGRVDPSPMLYRRLGEYDEEKEAQPAEEIAHWRDLAIVSTGASASASIQPGAATALQAEALRAAFVGGSDGPGEGTESGGADDDEQQTNTDQNQTMTDMDLTEDEEALIHTARSTDDPVVMPATKQALAQNADELNINQYDDPTVVESDEYETMTERVSSVKEVFSEALAARTDMKPETADALSLDVLIGEFEDDDGELQADALAQNPEAGGAGDPEDPGGSGGVQPDALSADQQDELESLAARAETFDGVDDDLADSLREEAADLAGADEWGDIEGEVV